MVSELLTAEDVRCVAKADDEYIRTHPQVFRRLVATNLALADALRKERKAKMALYMNPNGDHEELLFQSDAASKTLIDKGWLTDPASSEAEEGSKPNNVCRRCGKLVRVDYRYLVHSAFVRSVRELAMSVQACGLSEDVPEDVWDALEGVLDQLPEETP